MFAEDISVFFDTVDGFAVRCVWKRAGGDVVENVLLDEETVDVFSEERSGNHRQITYPTVGKFSDLSEGEVVEIDGTRYLVCPPRLPQSRFATGINDGALTTALIEKSDE